jgi:hypothetical protein
MTSDADEFVSIADAPE